VAAAFELASLPAMALRKRWRIVRNVLLSLVGLFLVFSVYEYFFVWRLSTRTTPAAVGSTAADFTLPDQEGRTASLAALSAHGPAVLVFYRGYW
jgi:hypothetical protein